MKRQVLDQKTLDDIIRRVAVDAILVSPTDVERYKDNHALVIKPALQEGRVVYVSS